MGLAPKPTLRRAGITRARVAAARVWCERQTLSLFSERQSPRSRILCYHSIGTRSWGINDVSPKRFRSQLETALNAGYRFVPAELIAAEPGDDPRLAITFDDGLASVAMSAAPVLKELGIPWTLFVVTDWADGKHDFGPGTMLGWGEIDALAAAGAVIGSHSVSHPNFGRISNEAAEQELHESRLTMSTRIGITPTSFAIPFGQSLNWTAFAQESAQRAGYVTVYAQSEERRHPGTVARTFVTKFDNRPIFKAALAGAFDRWEEWV